MNRRKFILALGGAAAWPLAARAQQAKRPIVGFLGDSTPLAESERAAAFARRLHDLGWIEGRTIAIEYRWADGRSDRLAEIAAGPLGLQLDTLEIRRPQDVASALDAVKGRVRRQSPNRCPRNFSNAPSYKRWGLRSPALASSMSCLAMIPLA